MKKPANLKGKLLVLFLYGLLLLLWYHLQLPCIPRAVTGIPCPTCGLTRAWRYALSLDLAGAFRQYPMFWSVPILVLFLLRDGQVFSSRKGNLWCLGILVGSILLIWAARILGFLGMLMPL